MLGRLIASMCIMFLILSCFAIGLSLLILSIVFPSIRGFAGKMLSDVPNSIVSADKRNNKRR